MGFFFGAKFGQMGCFFFFFFFFQIQWEYSVFFLKLDKIRKKSKILIVLPYSYLLFATIILWIINTLATSQN
jgi:hypothetical protein